MPKSWLIAFLFLATVALAKSPQPQKFSRPSPPRMGVEMSPRIMVGFNFSYGLSDVNTPGSTRNAPSFLTAMDFALGDGWYFSPGLGLLARGVQANVYKLGSLDIKGSIHLDYLEAPLLLKKAFASDTPGMRYTVFGGPAFAVAIQRQVELLGAVDWDIADRFFASDTLLYLGAGLEYRGASGPGVVAELRYALGLGDIDRSANQYRTRGILFLLGLKF